MFGNRRLAKRSIIGTKICAIWQDGRYYPGTIQNHPAEGDSFREQKYTVRFDDGYQRDVNVSDITGPGFNNISSLTLKHGQKVFLTLNGREVQGSVAEHNRSQDEVIVIVPTQSGDGIELIRKIDDLRLMESRKSARLVDQATDYSKLADLNVQGDKKRTVSHVIDVPSKSQRYRRPSSDDEERDVTQTEENDVEMMDETIAAMVLTSLSCSPQSPKFQSSQLTEVPVMLPHHDHNEMNDQLPPSLQQIEADLRKVMDDFVQVYERLDTGDDPTKKPNYSYTELVYLAVLRSPNFCLPITEIYRYIKSRFTFFRDSHRSHWKNAVRHSLSKTKCFTKIAVGKRHGVPGLPNRSSFLWCILPNSIVSFARGDYRPSVDKESGMNTLRWGYYKVNAGQFWSQVAIYLEKKFETFRTIVSNSSDPRHIVKFQICSLPDPSTQSDVTETPEVLDHVTDNSGVILPSNCQVGYGLETDFMSKFDVEKTLDTGNSSTDDDFSPKSTSLSTSVNDSGHETLESSPEDLQGDLFSWRQPKQNLNSSYLSFLPAYQNPGRMSPELPDLGHVSPFELSPLSNHGASPPPALMASTQNLLRVSPVPMTSPSYSDSYSSYYSPYQSSHVMYPALYDLAYSYPASYYPIQGNDPMMSLTPEWSGN